MANPSFVFGARRSQGNWLMLHRLAYSPMGKAGVVALDECWVMFGLNWFPFRETDLNT
jgi:hypothetical protein